MNGQKMLVIVPTYNEAQSVPRLISSVLELLPAIHVLVVDDGSPDGTADICQGIADGDSLGRVHIMRRAGKQGLGSAYISGFGWGATRGYQAIIEMDADGSHRPIDLVAMVAAFDADETIDCVIGSRWMPGGKVVNWAKQREALSRGANKYAKFMLGLKVNDITAGFRVYRSSLLGKIDFATVVSEGYCFQIEMTRKVVGLNAKIKEVPITFVEREFGVSKMSGNIVIEAMSRVTVWGLQRALKIGGRNNAR
jgi:dolichol-phosphate mannosyltransferase